MPLSVGRTALPPLGFASLAAGLLALRGTFFALELEVVSSFDSGAYETRYPVSSIAVDRESGVLLLGTRTEVIEVLFDGTFLWTIVEETLGHPDIFFFDRGLAVSTQHDKIYSIGSGVDWWASTSFIGVYTRGGIRLQGGLLRGGHWPSWGGVAFEDRPGSLHRLHLTHIAGAIQHFLAVDATGELSMAASLKISVRSGRDSLYTGLAFFPELQHYLRTDAIPDGDFLPDSSLNPVAPRLVAADAGAIPAGFEVEAPVVARVELEPLGICSVSDIARDPLTDHIFLVDLKQEKVFELAFRTTFRRGDANGDGRLDLSDAVFILRSLFLGGREPRCQDAADADDDGAVTIADAVFVLDHLFRGVGHSELLSRDCRSDPTDDRLTCKAQQPCLDNEGQ
jgi:hypothetical protein